MCENEALAEAERQQNTAATKKPKLAFESQQWGANNCCS